MPDQNELLGRRLKAARDALRLTQEVVAQHLGIPRPSVATIESGKRKVSSTELEKLAQLYHRDIQDFFAEEFHEEADPVPALFRAVRPDLTIESDLHDSVRNAMKIARTLTNLERLLGIHRTTGPNAKYLLPEPASKWDAIQQGEYLADEERRRLGLGWTPLSDLSELLESQGIRVAVDNLPPDVSGLVLTEPRTGVFVMINRQDVRGRRRFSHAHEYCHVLVDLSPNRIGHMSLAKDRASFIEVRANTFAACFLMPGEGVRQFVTALGKGRTSRYQGEVVDSFDEALLAEGRSEPLSQDIQLYDVLYLARHFGVSLPAALFRLRNLRLITEAELDRLKSENNDHGLQMESILGIKETEEQEEHSRNAFRRRFALLALEARRRKAISPSKLKELGQECGFQREVDYIVGASGSAFSEAATENPYDQGGEVLISVKLQQGA